MSDSDGKHWVEDLFPPAYSVDDVTGRQQEPSSTVFCEWLEDWLPFPRARRFRYQIDEQPDRQETDKLNSTEQASLPTRPQIADDSVTAITERSEDEDSSLESNVKESVWTWNEVCLLREHYDNVKSKKINLELHVNDLTQQLEMSTRKLSELFHVAERQFTLIQKLRRENEQLRKKSAQQNEEMRKAKEKTEEIDIKRQKLAAALDTAETKWKTLELTVADKEQQIFDLNVTLQNQKTKECITKKTAMMLLEEQHEERINNLTTQLGDLKLKLETCCEAHDRDKRALNQLRRHFAEQSMPRPTHRTDCMPFVYSN